MSNLWYDMMVDRCLDQVDELGDQEVLELVRDHVDSEVVNMDEARDLAADYLFGLEMADD